VLVALIGSACASGQGDEAGEPGPPTDVGLVVVNELPVTMTAYVQWRIGTRRRLGEIPGGASMPFSVESRGQDLRVIFVNPGQSPGDPPFPDYAPTNAGDRLRWVLRPDRSVYYLRIE
jgi:hypothetical protein